MIKIGHIIKSFGIKGEVKVKSFTSFANLRFKTGKEVLVKKKDGLARLTIESYKEVKNTIYLKFVDLEDINSILDLINCELFSEEKIDLPKDYYYYDQLIDLGVFYQEISRGVVMSVTEIGNDVMLRVSSFKKNYYLPLREQFIKEIDLASKKIILTDLGGDLIEKV